MNLNELLKERATAQPEQPCVISESDGTCLSYAQFFSAVGRVSSLMAASGIRKGDVVSLLLPNSAEYVIAYFACWRLGAIAGPVNSLLKAQEIAYVISNSEAKAILVHPDYADTIASIRGEIPSITAVISSTQVSELCDIENSSEELNPTSQIDGPDEAIIIYTSGTTGKSKGCLLTHENIVANARQISSWMKFSPADRILTLMPLFHMNAVTVTTVAPIYAGATTIISPRFSTSRFWEIVSNHKVTTFGSVATMLSMLLNAFPDGVPRGFKSKQLRFAMCGSAPVPVEVLRRFEETFNCLVIEGYGLSESTCRSTFNPPNERRRPGSCGLSIGNEMKVVDEEDLAVADGMLGEIVLRGENIFKGYYKDPEANKNAFRDGWFHTGDIGYRDSDGYFYIVDRKSDMIIRGGENIYPREIDEVLYQNSGVAAAATVGVSDPLYGEEVTSFVVLKEGARITEADLMAFCRERLADYKCPKSIRFVTEVPKGPTGKILKRELVKLISG